MLTSIHHKLTAPWRRFRKGDDGSATIEAVLWLPLFVTFFVMIADVSFVFHRQTQILSVVQDGNRALSVGRLAGVQELDNYLVGRLRGLTTNVEVDTIIADGIITTQVDVPVEDLVAVGMFNFLMGYNLSVKSQQFIEY